MRRMNAGPEPLLSVLQFEGVVIAALAVLFGFAWWRSRERGTPLLALGFAVTALWSLNGDRVAYAGPNIDTDLQRIWSSVVALGILLIALGVIRYLGTPRGRNRWALVPFVLPSIVTVMAVAVSPDVPRRVFHICALLPYAGAALLAFRRSTQHPGDGHVLLGVARLVPPLTPYVLLAAGLAPTQLLRDANLRLEARVNERTVHLHELIQGLEAFNRSVSHDLRGPLGGMSSLARMAADAMARGDTSMAQRALPVIADQCDASVRLVGTMLDLARVGDLPLNPETVCLTDLVHAAFDEVMLGAAPGVRPELRCGVMPAVKADPRLLRPVLVNLLGNAVKFSRDAPQPRIDVEATVRGTDLSLRVRDNGVGLPPGAAERLFVPFAQAHGPRFEGHGLGLSIVRRAVQAMGGRTWAERPPQGGAALCFTLPGAVIEAGAAQAHLATVAA